jgi:hypothetical protein
MINIKEKYLYILFILPILFYFILLLLYSVNKPFGDDFHSVLIFLNNYSELNSIVDKFFYLFTPHNEYKLVFSNIVQIILLKLNGQINFVHLIFLGFSGLVLIVLFIYKYFKSLNLPVAYFLPIPLIIFNLVQYNLSLWAMASMQSYFQYLFTFLSVYYLFKNKTYLFNLFFVFSMLQGGMWMPLFTVVFIKFILNKYYKKLFNLLLLTFLIVLFMYYTGFKKPEHDILQNMMQVIGIIKFSLGVIGSVFNIYHYAVLLAILILFLLIYILIHYKLNILNNTLSFNIIFILIVSIPALAINRIHTGIEASLTPRYSLTSIFLMVFIYLFLLENEHKKYRKNIFLIFLTFTIFLYAYNLKFIKNFKSRYLYVKINSYPACDSFKGQPVYAESARKKIFINKEIKFGNLKCIDSRLINTDDYYLATSSQIISFSYKIGAIYKKMNLISNTTDYGSFIDGDKSVGKIKFKICRDQSFLVLTGPRTEHQMIKIIDQKNGVIEFKKLISHDNAWMVYSLDWTKIKYDYLTVIISDNSSNWGEWSAVSFKH